MSDEPRSKHDSGHDERRPPTLWQSWMSVLAAFFGVQSSENRERDFTRGKASHFILLGVVATVLLVVLLVGLVKLATSVA
ncbi:hypothetical protein T35B1_07886 [Salinisphaera shabanensis T35B1]|uniref:DUF2970 domain-containing protein n=1 Tax=Salinisphaera shabanensis E1L3A TaxID=1033802 RepID=U2G0H6_9GAMM|nr:DUF2970 domain-containing protein [Salinisphaera shabanensis]ERJ19808.1 hypothetical protein SSPSH_001279 [Salinisphaera shabanensis E1L3A]